MSNVENTAGQIAGMGAILTDGGTAFRVWAPHAQRVTVVGDFNDWDHEKNSLESDDDGYWYAFVEDARAGQEYKFGISPQEGEMKLKNDPYARMLTNRMAIALSPIRRMTGKAMCLRLPTGTRSLSTRCMWVPFT